MEDALKDDRWRKCVLLPKNIASIATLIREKICFNPSYTEATIWVTEKGEVVPRLSSAAATVVRPIFEM
jgi:hypothetical protein